jgi:hypothetical protein
MYSSCLSDEIFLDFSLFKTLRPDKVPMQIPILTSGFSGSSSEKGLTECLAVAATRAETSSSSFKAIRWALHRGKGSNKNSIFPQITYIAKASRDKGKELLDCVT